MAETNDPHIIEIAGYLPVLERIEAICAEQGWHGEGMVTAGLTHVLAHMVESDSVPGSVEHDVAARITSGPICDTAEVDGLAERGA